MKVSKELIKAFRSVANKIEFDSQWDWNNSCNCNCGLLAQELGLSKIELSGCMEGTWTKTYQEPVCSETGHQFLHIKQFLRDRGIEYADILAIETIGFKDSLKYEFEKTGCMSNIEVNACVNKQVVSKWFRDKANEMERQLLNNNAKARRKTTQRVKVR